MNVQNDIWRANIARKLKQPKNHRERVFYYLQINKYLTSLTAITEIGIIDLPKVISDMNKNNQGLINIGRRTIQSRYGKSVVIGEYSLNRYRLNEILNKGAIEV